MKKLALVAIAATAIAASTSAFAWVPTPYGPVAVCGWVASFYGPVYVCN